MLGYLAERSWFRLIQGAGRIRRQRMPRSLSMYEPGRFPLSCWQLQSPSSCSRTVTGLDDSSWISTDSFPLLLTRRVCFLVVELFHIKTFLMSWGCTLVARAAKPRATKAGWCIG